MINTKHTNNIPTRVPIDYQNYQLTYFIKLVSSRRRYFCSGTGPSRPHRMSLFCPVYDHCILYYSNSFIDTPTGCRKQMHCGPTMYLYVHRCLLSPVDSDRCFHPIVEVYLVYLNQPLSRCTKLYSVKCPETLLHWHNHSRYNLYNTTYRPTASLRLYYHPSTALPLPVLNLTHVSFYRVLYHDSPSTVGERALLGHSTGTLHSTTVSTLFLHWPTGA